MYHWDALSGNVSLSCSLPVFILDKYYIISFSWKKSLKQNIKSSWSFLKHCCCVIWFPFISIFEKELAGGGAGAGSPSQLMFYSISSSLDARSMFNLSSSPSSVKGAVCKFHQEGGGGAFIYCPLFNHLIIFLFVWKILYAWGISFGGQCLFKHTCFPETISVQL